MMTDECQCKACQPPDPDEEPAPEVDWSKLIPPETPGDYSLETFRAMMGGIRKTNQGPDY